MRIAVNTRLLLPGRLDGIGWFTCESLRRIVTTHPEHDFFFLFDRKPDQQFVFSDNVHPVVLHPQARHPILWYIYFQWSVPRALRKLKAHLFVSTDGWMPLGCPIPLLDVIHDLNFEHATDYLRPSHQRYMTRFFPRFAKGATRIATVSEFSKKDIVETYGIEPEKIDVVYNGSHSLYRPCSDSEKENARSIYSEGNPYYIFIGTLSPRKNLPNVLKAFDLYKDRYPDSTVRLLVVGGTYRAGMVMEDTLANMRHGKDVRFVGHVDSDILSLLLGSAEALLYPSLFEGFGIPIVEAFYAETPVITANVTSMPEVAGDAALLTDPTSPESIAGAMCRLHDEQGLRETLIARGRERRVTFSWERTANLLWDSMMATMNAETLK